MPVERDSEVERSETELERETGVELPGTKHRVEFVYGAPLDRST
jgi:hypothetical protein